MTSKLCIFPFYIFLFFAVDKGVALAPTYPQGGIQTYVVLAYQVILFCLSGDHFKALDHKNDPFYLVRN